MRIFQQEISADSVPRKDLVNHIGHGLVCRLTLLFIATEQTVDCCAFPPFAVRIQRLANLLVELFRLLVLLPEILGNSRPFRWQPLAVAADLAVQCIRQRSAPTEEMDGPNPRIPPAIEVAR